MHRKSVFLRTSAVQMSIIVIEYNCSERTGSELPCGSCHRLNIICQDDAQKRGYSSAGRALASQVRGRGFEPPYLQRKRVTQKTSSFLLCACRREPVCFSLLRVYCNAENPLPALTWILVRLRLFSRSPVHRNGGNDRWSCYFFSPGPFTLRSGPEACFFLLVRSTHSPKWT